jgi:prevent-host-death family protein
MFEVASRELRNNTRKVLDRVEAGEEIVITVDGRPRAKLVPIDARPMWMPKEEFLAGLVQADAALGDDLLDLYGHETTDDIDPWR